MTYHNADKEEAMRLWTTSISETLHLGGYKDSGYIIGNEVKGAWDTIFLESEQMAKFVELIDTKGTVSLGEGSLTGEMTAHYKDGVYTLEPENLEIKPTITEEEGDEIVRIFAEIMRAMKHHEKAMEMKENLELL